MFGKIHLKGAMIGAGTAVLLGIAPAGASEIDDLKAEIKALQERLAKIEAAQKEAGKKAVIAGDKAGSWKMPGSETSISISGYVKGDFYVDDRAESSKTFDAPAIPLDGATEAGDDDGNVGMHAQQSRLRFDTHTPTEMGALNTRIETDFNPYGPAQLRLRQPMASSARCWRDRPGRFWVTITPPLPPWISTDRWGLPLSLARRSSA